MSLQIDGLPPDGTHSGRSADRDSPNAGPLARVADKVIAHAPEAFPISDPLGIRVVFGRTEPDFEGYYSIDPIIEVLVDVGMIEDERLEEWERGLQDPSAGESYTVTIEPSAPENTA